MGYRSLSQCVADLERHGHLVRIQEPVNASLEVAEIHRRVFAAGGPAVFYANVQGCRFPMVSNLFGTMERARFMFRDSLDHVKRLIGLKLHPESLLKSPLQGLRSGLRAMHMLPRQVRSGPVLDQLTSIEHLPQLKSWPLDGGGFITLPIVYSEDVDRPGLAGSNLGMYRVQLTGNQYKTNEQIGLHYQIHRGMGVHHARAIAKGTALRVNIFVGGTPAMTVAAVMPLPEGMSELGFAGAMAGHRIPMIRRTGWLPIYAHADFCISGYIEPDVLLPEGPFGDHLGYYSLAHPFPVLRVEKVYHRAGAIWPFTVVGRPPQEDTIFGELIHELTAEAIPATIPGVRQVHAVDAAGVHPLLLAVGSERYVPFQQTTEPQEILTQAHAILGQGQLSLAKFLWIVAQNDAPDLDVQDVPAFFAHVLARIDLTRDVHFHTCTTMDTLDYSGKSLNSGSKVVLAAAGKPRRELPVSIPAELGLPAGYGEPRVMMPGVLVIEAHAQESVTAFCQRWNEQHPLNAFPLIVLVDDSKFTAASLANFLWITFTRCNPAADIDGISSFIEEKHWGCRGSLVIDARRKPHHAPILESDPEVCRKVDALAARGLPISPWL